MTGYFEGLKNLGSGAVLVFIYVYNFIYLV